MKKIKKKLKKLNNQGSSIVMVVAALGFMGIIVGALLMAAGYTYRQKLQDLNARDNFYYVEQAMNEIYAGVGSKTAANMQEAYIYTVENMVYFDLQTGTYKNRSDEDANRMFKEKFMSLLSANPDFSDAAVASSLASYITNSSVTLDATKLYVERNTDPTTGKVKSITIKNVTLTRTEEYNRSQANGSYTQTISTDIVISEPDFTVAFNSSSSGYVNLFEFATVADMGLEINQTPSNSLTISGNIYAGSDYYNKKYNESTYKSGVVDADKTFSDAMINDSEGNPISYNHGSVTSKRYVPAVTGNGTVNTYYNAYSTLYAPENAGSRDYYDGVNMRSANSGIYINGSSVSILADKVIVPGTIAVMNSANLSIYGKSGTATSESEVWTDNIVLDGTSRKTTRTVAGQPQITYEGATAIIRADLFVKDDTEINATGSTLQIKGSYYGYGDSTSKDERDFIPTVLTENFQIENADGSVENRGHYNSSAIIVNGERSLLNLEETDVIYLAGRSYIELSKQVAQTEEIISTADDQNQSVIRQTYEYTPMSEDNLYTATENDTVYLRDYKTGESISLKSNQKAYIPVMFTGTPALDTVQINEGGTMVTVTCFRAKLHTGLEDTELFEKYFPKTVFGKMTSGGNIDVYIPCVMQQVSGKKYYYYDFETAYRILRASGRAADYASAQYYAADFIKDYVEVLNDEDCEYSKYLVDIRDYEDFEAGEIILPEMDNDLNINPVYVYSSGAITSKAGTSFDMITSNDPAAISNLLSTQDISDVTLGSPTELQGAGTAIRFSDDLDVEYEIMKWNLGHYDLPTDPEAQYVRALIADPDFGTASITPINKYLNMRKIEPDNGTIGDLRPASGSETGNEAHVLKLESGYSVWVNNGVSSGAADSDSVFVTAPTGSNGVVKGLVITKGDVYFDRTVTSFEGLIVAGGKVYVNENLSTLTASPEICRAVIRECQLSADPKCEYLLSLFKGYEDSTVENIAQSGTDRKTIDNIEYSDVVSFDNWMKNVE